MATLLPRSYSEHGILISDSDLMLIFTVGVTWTVVFSIVTGFALIWILRAPLKQA
ncbi:MAG: hypothetical protein ACJ78Q_02685 [Chloroflexia bacterium]